MKLSKRKDNVRFRVLIIKAACNGGSKARHIVPLLIYSAVLIKNRNQGYIPKKKWVVGRRILLPKTSNKFKFSFHLSKLLTTFLVIDHK